MDEQARTPWWRTLHGLVLCGFLVIAGFFLITEHSAHLYGALPSLLQAACPLMHLFMHHGHRDPGHSDQGASGSGKDGQISPNRR